MQGIRSFLHIMCLIEKRKNAEIWDIYNIEYPSNYKFGKKVEE